MLKEIEKRQSIRKYLDKPVEKEKLIEMLKAAMRAPTAMNTQDWVFYVIQDKELMLKIGNFLPHYKMFLEAGAGIIACGDINKSAHNYSEFLHVDVAAAIENILLEGVNEGLGTCWCAISPSKERMDFFIKELNLKENIIPVAAIAVGYPNEVKELQERFDENKIIWL